MDIYYSEATVQKIIFIPVSPFTLNSVLLQGDCED